VADELPLSVLNKENTLSTILKLLKMQFNFAIGVLAISIFYNSIIDNYHKGLLIQLSEIPICLGSNHAIRFNFN
jgi:hypothetical protein